MRCSRWWGVLILTGALMPALLLAQATKSVDPVGDAIQTLKDSAEPKLGTDKKFKMKLQQARDTLLKNRAQGLPAVVTLLKRENVPQIRLNAAIVLAEYARQKGDTPKELIEGLKQCVGDSNDGVKYYGVLGMLDTKAPAEMKKEAVKTCLDKKRSRVLRVLTANAVSSRKFRPAAPVMVAYLQSLLGDYERALNNRLTVEKKSDGSGEREMRDDRRAPEAAGRPTTRPPSPRERTSSRDARRSAPGAEPDIMAKTVEVERIRIDPGEWSAKEAEAWWPEILELPECKELLRTGLYLEDIASENFGESKFGFKDTPPWDLKKCVEKAVQWMKAKGGA